MASYERIRPGRDIRLLVIRPSTAWASPIFCELRVVNLARDQVFFEVLFPVAPTPGGAGYIVFLGDGGGARHPVPANLESALRAMRYNHESRLLWVEAVCVNQADPVDRAVHREMTMQIYQAAGRSISWVGETEHGPGTDSTEAMRLVREIGRWAHSYRLWVPIATHWGGLLGVQDEAILPLALRWRNIDWDSVMRLLERIEEAGAGQISMPLGNEDGNGQGEVFRGNPGLIYCGRFRVPRSHFVCFEVLIRGMLRRIEVMTAAEWELFMRD
ncbi:hypothetical protein V8F20_006952 [Naviculisporaceae sp. PSN 640]